MTSQPLIEARGLSKAYGGVHAVQGLDFSVGKGEVVGFLGPNGAGKSTTLRMLVGFLAPTAGQVRVNGFDVVEEPLAARRALGYMPEAAPLYPEMRVSEYLGFRAALKDTPRRELNRSVQAAAAKAGVADALGTLIGELSRGYRQRVALADALLANPPLLILDEPTAGLDPNQIRSVRELIRGLGSEHTVLLSTHILSEVESTCSRVIVIDHGLLVAEGPLSALRERSERRARLGLRDPGGNASGILVRQPGVAQVQRAPAQPAARGTVSYVLTFQAEASSDAALEAAVAALVQAGIGVHEACAERTSLEELFQRLTASEAA